MPDWKPHLRARLASLRLSPVREAEIIEELSQHLEDRWRELIAQGAAPDDAAETARTEFDGARLQALLGTLRQAHWHEAPPPGPGRAFSSDSAWIDFRHAIRALKATPSFTIGALLVLALGTGATTAIYSIVDAVALRPLPFSDPDRIVAVGERPAAGTPAPGPAPNAPRNAMPGAMPGAKPPDPDALMRIRPQDYLDWVAGQQVFESIAAIDDTGRYTLQSPGGEPQVVVGHRVTSTFFDVLRATPAMGVPFTSHNEATASNRVIVVSHAFWQRTLGGDPLAIGRTLPLDGDSYEVVGVMPASFRYPLGSAQPAEVWMPLALNPEGRVPGGVLQSIARLKPEVSIAQAQAQMTEVAAAGPRGIGIRPLRDHLVGSSTRTWLLMLLATASIVLLIACANVANLWLARASVQQREAAVRAALGASRGRLAQRVLVESLTVSVSGTVLGLGLAWLCMHVITAALPENISSIATIGIDARVLAVAGLAALATGLISGIGPALQGSRPGLAALLNESGRGGGTSRAGRHARAALAIAEVGLAVVLLVGSALFIGSFVNVMRLDTGFRSDHVLTAQVFTRPGSSTTDLRPSLDEVVARAERLPGVVNAAWASGIPLRINLLIDALGVPGQPIDPNMRVNVKVVTAGYHRTLAIPLEGGRYFTVDDRTGAEPVVILSEAAARMFFAGGNAIGQTVVIAGERRVVGVVADARQSSIEVNSYPEVYIPLAQNRTRSVMFLLLRTTGDPMDTLPALRAMVAQVLPLEPLRQISRMDDLVASQTAERRLNMLMFGAFGLLGLVISTVGLFGVLAYLVSQQTREIGVRMALGASRARVVSSVVGHAGALVTAGLVLGGSAAWTMSHLTGRFLFGLDPRDTRAYAVAMASLVAAAVMATVLPARRAASVNPIEALRRD
jgi:putative ABC transport system permease protein